MVFIDDAREERIRLNAHGEKCLIVLMQEVSSGRNMSSSIAAWTAIVILID